MDLYRLIVESAPDAVIWADREGIIRVWTQAAENYLGYSKKDAIGQSLGMLIPEVCRDRHWAAYHRWMTTGEDRIAKPFGVIPLIHRDGTTVPMESTFVRVKDADGNTVGAGAIVRPAGMSTA